MALVSEIFECEECGFQRELVLEREDRDNKISCSNCGKQNSMGRILACTNVRTDKTSKTFIDGQNKRFGKLREERDLKREKAAIHKKMSSTQDVKWTQEEKRVVKEIKKVRDSKS